MIEKDRAEATGPQSTVGSDETPELAEGSVSANTARPLPAAAKRALAEAEARRAAAEAGTAPVEKELGGRDGPEPTRFGDWEKGGIASDF